MGRGVPDETGVAMKCSELQLAACCNIPLQELHTPLLKKVVRSIVALHVASHNCDFYITKYQSKPMEMLQNVVTQFALGLERLENELATAEPLPTHQKAKRIVTRLAMACNRSSWVSTTEMASTLMTGAHFWCSHDEVPLFLSRCLFLVKECIRLLNGSNFALIEPAAVNINAVEIKEPDDNGLEVSDVENNLDPDDAEEELASADDQDKVDQTQEEQNNETFAVLRTTTSLHDDWLHRGEILRPLSFIVYASRVHRVRKPAKVNADSAEIYYPFEPHYALSHLYCQQIRNRVRITRLVGCACPPCTHDSMEEHAEYNLVLFGDTFCPGPGCCSDPLMFRNFAFKPQRRQTLHAFSPGWKAEKAFINVLAVKAEKKEQLSHKIAVTKTWWPPFVTPQQLFFAVTLKRMFFLKCPGAWDILHQTVCNYLHQPSGMHEQQLHLSEFNALPSRLLMKNLNLQCLAKGKPLEKQSQNFDNAQDETDSDADRQATRPQHSEFLEGDGEEIDFDEDEFFDDQRILKPNLQVSLDECQSLMCRTFELERLSKPGRKRESDIQVKSFSDWFGSRLNTPLEAKTWNKQCPSKLPPCAATAAGQQSMLSKHYRENSLAMCPTETSASGPLSTEAAVRQLQELLKRNADKQMQETRVVSLEDAWLGPVHVTLQLLKKFPFNQEQVESIALLIYPLQKYWENRNNKETYMLPPDVPLVRAILMGGGEVHAHPASVTPRPAYVLWKFKLLVGRIKQSGAIAGR